MLPPSPKNCFSLLAVGKTNRKKIIVTYKVLNKDQLNKANIAVKTGDIADIGKDEDFEGKVNNFLRLVGGVER